MKHSRAETHRKTHKIPAIRFEDQSLTSFAGLVVFQRLFVHLNLKERLGVEVNGQTSGTGREPR